MKSCFIFNEYYFVRMVCIIWRQTIFAIRDAFDRDLRIAWEENLC